MVLDLVIGKLIDEHNEKNGHRDRCRDELREKTRKLQEKYNKNVCPECGEHVDNNYKYCPECGYEL